MHPGERTLPSYRPWWARTAGCARGKLLFSCPRKALTWQGPVCAGSWGALRPPKGSPGMSLTFPVTLTCAPQAHQAQTSLGAPHTSASA